jgi:hypothetical protein
MKENLVLIFIVMLTECKPKHNYLYFCVKKLPGFDVTASTHLGWILTFVARRRAMPRDAARCRAMPRDAVRP